MGLKGNLSSVSLAEVFQTLSTGSSTGLLRIQAPEGPRFVELQNGVISIAGRSAGRVMLGDLLISRGLIDDTRLDEALRMQKETGKMLGEVLIESGAVTLEQLQNALRFQIEEEVCELFTLKNGDFDFLDGAGLDSRMAPAGGLVRVNLDLNHLLAEAARRAEEWAVIEQRIPSQALIFATTSSGDELLKGSDGLSPEGMILLRLAKTHRTVEAMVQKACLGRFTTNRMLLELWDAGILEPESFKNYDRIAKEHMRLNRHEEAQRVADLLVERGTDDEKAQGKALLQEIARTRKPPAPTTSAYVRADPKVRSEVIRRNQPGLILKKEKSWLPVILVFVVVLVGVGGGAYLTYFKGKGGEASISRKQLEEIAAQSNTYIAEGKYSEGLQLLRDFRSFDPTIQKQANDQFENRQRDVETMMIRNIEKFDDAIKSGLSDDIEKATATLVPMLDISVNNPSLEAMRVKSRKEINSRRDRKRAEQYSAKLKEIEATEKPKGNEALLKAYENVLSENPPEISAARVRDSILQMRSALADAQISVAHARTLRAAVDLDMARVFYDRARQRFPGSALATEADMAIAEITQTMSDSQARFDKIQLLVTQNKTEEARVALLAYLDSKPPRQLWARALLALHGIDSVSETNVANAYKAATALWEKQPEEARKKIIELAEKNPNSSTASMATLKISVTSQPEGASVQVDGKPSGVTPLTVEVPAMGITHLTFSKEGFRSEDVIRNNLREERVSVALERLPSVSALMPVAARNGMAPASDSLVFSGAGEAVICSRFDFKLNSRISLPGATAASTRPPPLVAWMGEAYILQNESKSIFRLDLANGSVRQIALDQPATSSPIPFNGPDMPPASLFGLATKLGFESYKDDDGKLHKRVALGQVAAQPAGLAFDGAHFFLPRSGGLLVAVAGIEGLKKWEATVGAEISGTPAYSAALKAVAVASAGGRVTAYDGVTGTERWKQELKAEIPFGVQTLSSGFLIAQSGKALMLAGDSGQTVWTAQLPGDPELAPLVIRAGGKDRVALCTKQGETHTLSVFSADKGELLWRKTLDTAPVAIAADETRLYVSTTDAVLLGFDVK